MKAALIGAGYWGPNLARALTGLGHLDGLIVCDRDPERRAKMAARYPSAEITAEYDAVLEDPAVEAILLATPISTHGPLGLRALEANKHVFVEKPMAASVEEARTLIDLAEQKERVLMVGHTFEYAPPVLRARELIENNELGDLFFISMMRVNLGLHQSDVSVLWDLVSHDLSILFFWLRETPCLVSAFGRDCVQTGIPDVAFVNLRFPSGVIANIEVAWLAPSKLRRIAVVGKRKMLVYDDTENVEKVKIYDQGVDFQDPESFGEYQLSYRTGDIVSPRLSNAEPLRLEVEHFFDAIITGRRPRSDGRSGLRVVETLEAAERALASGTPVTMNGQAF